MLFDVEVVVDEEEEELKSEDCEKTAVAATARATDTLKICIFEVLLEVSLEVSLGEDSMDRSSFSVIYI